GLPEAPAAGSYEARINDWADGEFAAGRGAEPAAAMRMMVRLARGDAGVLSGRPISVPHTLPGFLPPLPPPPHTAPAPPSPPRAPPLPPHPTEIDPAQAPLPRSPDDAAAHGDDR